MISNNNNSLTYGRGYVYKIQYHIVWCVKYRRKIIKNDIELFLKQEIISIASEMGITITTMECMPDYIHLLLDCSPQDYIPTIIKILKGNSARHLFMRFPKLKEQLYDEHLWNPSYFVATVSENIESQIKEYISNQKTK